MFNDLFDEKPDETLDVNEEFETIAEESDELTEAKRRLLEYEEKEKAGMIIVPPCEIGDEVWVKRDGEVKKVCAVAIKVEVVLEDEEGLFAVPAREVGKTVFTTKSLVEKAFAGIK